MLVPEQLVSCEQLPEWVVLVPPEGIGVFGEGCLPFGDIPCGCELLESELEEELTPPVVVLDCDDDCALISNPLVIPIIASRARSLLFI